MRYEVVEGPMHGGLGQYFKDRFSIKLGNRTIAFLLGEAEARTMAFALNAVASGRTLLSVNTAEYRHDECCVVVEPGDAYDGPTDGLHHD